jgi:hypothetical protein
MLIRTKKYLHVLVLVFICASKAGALSGEATYRFERIWLCNVRIRLVLC